MPAGFLTILLFTFVPGTHGVMNYLSVVSFGNTFTSNVFAVPSNHVLYDDV